MASDAFSHSSVQIRCYIPVCSTVAASIYMQCALFTTYPFLYIFCTPLYLHFPVFLLILHHLLLKVIHLLQSIYYMAIHTNGSTSPISKFPNPSIYSSIHPKKRSNH
eukprot:879697_1